MQELFHNYLQGEKVTITSAYSVFNPSLGSAFAIHRATVRDRCGSHL